MGTITRKFEFDTAHRVMFEKVKCFNLHGHRFVAEVTFDYDEVKAIGYAIDFKELKRVLGAYIDECLDHGSMLNPMDTPLIELCKSNKWKLWLMGLGNGGDVNPSAENIASEIFYLAETLFSYELDGVRVMNVRLYETPNCWVDCTRARYQGTEEFKRGIELWRKYLGNMTYDSREE